MKFSVLFVLGLIGFTTVEAIMSWQQKHRCEEYTSIFENDTTELQYEYCENINDGRGYTSGRAGFCTGTGDAIIVVKKYTAQKKSNPLAKYIPELERLAKHPSADTSKLHGYCDAWREAAKDETFRKCQDAVVDDVYYYPAMDEANKAGVKTTALGRCAFYDTIIQHGGGTDPDSLHSIVKMTEQAMGGKANSGNEHKWVLTFLGKRKWVLEHAHDKSTREAWRQSVDRVDAMVTLANQNNWDLHPPMHIKTKNHDKTIRD